MIMAFFIYCDYCRRFYTLLVFEQLVLNYQTSKDPKL